MAHELPPLPYDVNDLEPHIDVETMKIHHGKHHQAYVTNLNAALEKHPQLQSKSVEDLIRNLTPCPTTSAARSGTTAAVIPTTPCSGS
jgi:Fe-Mn family superoxide dismutase